MATHSSILTWEIPWTEEHSRLQSTGPQELDMTEQRNYHQTHVQEHKSLRKETSFLACKPEPGTAEAFSKY